MRRAGTTIAWVVTRGLTLALLFRYEGARGVGGDLTYFAQSLADLHNVGLGNTLVEYPLPAVGVLALPWLAVSMWGAAGLFAVAVVMCALVTDAVFTAHLAAQYSDGWRDGLAMWLTALPMLGGISLARFDLLVGVVVATGLLAVQRYPRVASLALSVATAVKLWPVILIPAVIAGARRRRDAVGTVLVVGALLAVSSVIIGGWARLLSPMTYQATRGLQIESVSATPVVVARLAAPARWPVKYAPSKSFEVTGPAVDAMLLVSTLLTLALLLGLLGLWWRALRPGAQLAPEGLVWLSLVSLAGFLVSTKVFSPQYLLWLLPVAAVSLVISPGPLLRRWSAGLLVVSGLTHLIYPWLYRGLVFETWQTPVVTWLLVLRNVLTVLLMAMAAREAWRLTARSVAVDALPVVLPRGLSAS